MMGLLIVIAKELDILRKDTAQFAARLFHDKNAMNSRPLPEEVKAVTMQQIDDRQRDQIEKFFESCPSSLLVKTWQQMESSVPDKSVVEEMLKRRGQIY